MEKVLTLSNKRLVRIGAKKVILYLTDEQKNDHTKIPRTWQKGATNVKEWTETIDNEKAVWTIKEMNT